MLASHPDQRFATFLRRCIEQGFRIRVLPSWVLHTHSTHLPSAASHSELISRYIVEEVWQAHLRHCLLVLRQSISAPLASSQNPISPGNSGLWSLSLPHGASINETIPPELASIHYPRVDQTAALIAQHSWGALIAKLDLHSAYRKIPVHPDDGMLLGIKWLDTIYIDRTLPFGFRSAPKLFTTVADGS